MTFPPVTRVASTGQQLTWVAGLRVAVTTRRFGAPSRTGEFLAVGPGPGVGFSPQNQPAIGLFSPDGQPSDLIYFDDPGFQGGVFVGGE